VMTRLHAEIARSVNFYKSQQNGTSPKQLLLLGGSSVISYADHFFKEKMEVEVEYFNPFKNIPIQVPAGELEKVAHSMGEVVGLGLRLVTECPIEINLVPPVVIKRRQFKRKMPFFIASMAGVIVLILSLWLYYWRVTHLLSRYRNAVSEEVDRLSQVESKLNSAEKFAAKVQSESAQIHQVIKARYYWLAFFEELQRCVPPDIWITQLTPENNQMPISFSSGATKTSAPVTTGRGRGRSGGAPSPGMSGPMPGPYGGPIPTSDETSAPAESSSARNKLGGITGFEIWGLCLNDPNSPKPLAPFYDFQERLSKSNYFDGNPPQIVEQRDPEPKDWTFAFRIRVKLKKTIPY